MLEGGKVRFRDGSGGERLLKDDVGSLVEVKGFCIPNGEVERLGYKGGNICVEELGEGGVSSWKEVL